MIFIYGLGNNEDRYFLTKHNIGRLVVEKLAKLQALNFKKIASSFVASNQDLALAYPDGFMNLSGKQLQSTISYLKLDMEVVTMIILQDDSDQIEGNFKLVQGGRSGGHNGINSIHGELFRQIDIEKMWRLKIGIRPPENRLKSETFVLKRLTQTDEKTVDLLSDLLHTNLELLNSNNLEKLQMLVNTKKM